MRFDSCRCALFLPLIQACLGTDAPAAEPQSSPVSVQIFDWSGEAVATEQSPRRPVIEIAGGGTITDPAESLFLFAGAVHPDLIDDLAARPLRAATRAAAIPLEMRTDGSLLRLVPTSPLAAGLYAVALASWARDGNGRRLTDGDTALWTFTVSDDPAAGARVVATMPPDGALALGTNLEHIVVAFDGAVQDDPDALWLETPDGFAVPADVAFDDCEEIDAFVCATLTPTTRLMPNTRYALVVSGALLDAHGAPLPEFSAEMHVGPGPDRKAPVLAPPTCAIDETWTEAGCLLADDRGLWLRATLSESAFVQASAGGIDEPAGVDIRTHAGPGQLTLALAPLPPATEVEVVLRVRDTAGNEDVASLLTRTTEQLDTLSLVELLADPRGPEPAQEFIEVHNFGASSVDLEGHYLGDDLDELGELIEQSAVIPPGQRVLLVADDFDAAAPADVAPPPGLPIVRVGRALAGNGLANAGESIFLRDQQGRRLSAAPALPRPTAGVCLVRTGDDPRDGSPGAFALDPNATCTPGW